MNSIFLPIKEIQAIMKLYNTTGDDRNYQVDYAAWVQSLKMPLTGRRLLIVQEAWAKLNSEKSDSISVGQARASFGFEVFPKWCEMIGVEDKDDASISCQQFMDFYADVSMAVFDDGQFINLVSDSWKVSEAAHLKVGAAALQQLVATFRQSLLKRSNKAHNEEFVLRELFRNFERQNNGVLTLDILRAMLEKVDVTVSDEYLEALLQQADLSGNANGIVEFDEFIHYVIQDRYTKKQC